MEGGDVGTTEKGKMEVNTRVNCAEVKQRDPDRACAVTVELRSQVLVHGRNGRIDLPSTIPSTSHGGSSNGARVREIVEGEGEGSASQCRACAASLAWGFYQVTEIYTFGTEHVTTNLIREISRR